jgi:hypothetical protein
VPPAEDVSPFFRDAFVIERRETALVHFTEKKFNHACSFVRSIVPFSGAKRVEMLFAHLKRILRLGRPRLRRTFAGLPMMERREANSRVQTIEAQMKATGICSPAPTR